MNKFLLLFKNYLKMDFRATKNGKPLSKGTKILYACCYLYLVIILAVISYSLSSTYAPAFTDASLVAEFFCVVFTMSQIVMLVFGFVLFIGRLYASNDNDIIGYMPLSENQIFWAKFMATYVWLFVINAIILISAFIGYAISCGFGFLLVICLILSLIIAPIFPMLLASIITTIIMPFYNALKKNKIILSVVCIALICIALYFYFQMIGSNLIAFDGEQIVLSNTAISAINLLADILFFNTILGEIVIAGFTFVDFIILIVSYALLISINVLIAKFVMRKATRNSYEESNTEINNQVKLGASINKTVLKKEFLSIVRFPSLMIYCSANLILPPLLILFSNQIFVGLDYLMPYIVFMIMTFLGSSLQMFALSSFTREREQFHFTKTLPISFKELANIKVKVALIVNVVSQILSIIACMFVMSMTFYMYIVVFVLSFIVSTAISYLDVLFDAKNPKLNWESIYTAMQNNINSVKSLAISSLFLLVFGLCFVICYFALSTIYADLIVWGVGYLLGIALLIIANKTYNKNIEKYIKEIE
ncbi:MAG: hypothetical protein IJZ29_04785 [Clostridia bacterium]|nr:hypothetical protein [Clostridia bacterium]